MNLSCADEMFHDLAECCEVFDVMVFSSAIQVMLLNFVPKGIWHVHAFEEMGEDSIVY